MKKILFIDNWSQGKNFILPVLRKFQENNYECVFLHADSSYLNQTFKNLKPVIDSSYTDYDISSYDNSMVKALRAIKPDAIIFISIHGVFHRWGNHIANTLNIPCFFFMHGIRISNPPRINRNSKKVYYLKRALFYTKQFRFFAKDIVKIQGVDKVTLKFLFYYYREFIFQNYQYTNRPKINVGFNYRIMFVNMENDIEYFKNNYPISERTNFIISGNVSSVEPAIRSLNYDTKKEYITFISQPGLIEESEYINLINYFANIFKFSESKFIFRPHPRDNETLLNSLLENKIEISQEKSAVDFARSIAAIGINSAMLLGFMKLKTPIIQIIDGENPPICTFAKYDNTIYFNSNLDQQKTGVDILKEINKFKIANQIIGDLKSPSQIIYDNIVKSF